MTSELSNALNPYGIQTRSRPSDLSYSNLQPVVQRPQEHIPHRSELELAISEPPAPPPRPRNQPAHAVQELFRILSATREAQEIERKRRLAWEQELEAKYAQRQAEAERQAFDMRQEIAALRAFISLHPSMTNNSSLVPEVTSTTLVVEQQSSNLPILSTSTPQLSPDLQPNLIQGSSTSPTPNEHPAYSGTASLCSPHGISMDLAFSASPSPQLTHLRGSPPPSGSERPSSNRRKRHTSTTSSNEGNESSGAESSRSSPKRPAKRTNHHDTRYLTIQHVVRAHILLAMEVESDKHLPDSHIEGAPLAPSEPVRFVWEKTPKQSVHNGRMKARVLADLRAKRRLYKHVHDKEFNKKTLENAFDQAYVTLRQKFRTQRDASVAIVHKKKEDNKALRSRRAARKKTKLANRSDTRNRIEAFEHITFDGALQMECMSSEESDGETPSQGGCLRVRGFAWRSSRLQKFFDTLDEEDELDKTLKPKRGIGRKERFPGPVKDGFPIPPKGIASWMVSRRWINAMRVDHPELLELLKGVIVDPPGFNWDQFHALGDESDDEVGVHTLHNLHDAQQHYIPQCDTSISSSSLHYALAHVS